jgi:membrane-bound serine protease (ClpP class)
MVTRPKIQAAALMLALLPALVRADTILKKDGQTLRGQIIATTATDITLQSNVGELIVRQKIAMKDIDSIHRDSRAENRYCRIPIHGAIGTDVKADWLGHALEQAADFGATVVVLDFDSPGGSVSEMASMLDVLHKNNKLPLIAHVKQAMSAAAIVAISCRVLILKPGATIGAAVPFKIGSDGLPKDIEAKYVSAFRALCRAAASNGRHSPLIAQGMMDINLVLSTVQSEDGVTVVEGTPAGSTRLKKNGEILCLSADDALRCGLATAIVDAPQDLQRALALKDWSPVGEAVWAYMESRPLLAKANHEREAEAQLAIAQRKRMEQQLVAIDARVAQLNKTKADAATRLDSIPSDCDKELSQLDPKLPLADKNTQTVAIKAKYEALYNQTQNTAAQADAELQELQKARESLTNQLRGS